MSVRGNLAENLRRLCLAKGSINAACRAMGINRQQFDRYITMQSTPNPTTLAKLCKYFEIEEQELFADPPSIAFNSGRPTPERLLASCKDTLEPLFQDPAPSLKPGIYYTWIAIPGRPDQVVCAPTMLRKDGETITFRRITGAGEHQSSMWSQFIGDHQGVVVERLHCFIFSGINQRGLREPSMIRLRWMPISIPTMGGHGMILSQNGPSNVAVIMRRAADGTSLRQALRNSRTFAINDPFVGTSIANCIEQQRLDLIAEVNGR